MFPLIFAYNSMVCKLIEKTIQFIWGLKIVWRFIFNEILSCENSDFGEHFLRNTCIILSVFRVTEILFV